MSSASGYVLSFDLYRSGNATSPRLDVLRERDIEQFVDGGVVKVRANGEGISVATIRWLKSRKMTGHVYLLEAGSTVIPGGLILAPAGNGHFHIAPLHDMPLAKYVDLLRILSGSCVYAGRIEDLAVDA